MFKRLARKLKKHLMASELNSLNIPIDIFSDEKKIIIFAEIPGAEKKDITIDFYNNKLTIKANKYKKHQELKISEIFSGQYKRVITLPICVTRSETVSKNYENGILCIEINKFIEEQNSFSITFENDDKN